MSITLVAAEERRAFIKAIAAANTEKSTRQSMRPKVGGSMMNQQTFNWDMGDQILGTKNLTLEVNNIFKSYKGRYRKDSNN